MEHIFASYEIIYVSHVGFCFFFLKYLTISKLAYAPHIIKVTKYFNRKLHFKSQIFLIFSKNDLKFGATKGFARPLTSEFCF